jgi:phage terminase small subunit
LKIVTGNPGKRAISRAEARPPAKLPKPPRELIGEAARKEWFTVSKQLYELGLLTAIDRTALAAYCQAYGRWSQAEHAIAAMAEKDPVMHGLLVKTSNTKSS